VFLLDLVHIKAMGGNSGAINRERTTIGGIQRKTTHIQLRETNNDMYQDVVCLDHLSVSK